MSLSQAFHHQSNEPTPIEQRIYMKWRVELQALQKIQVELPKILIENERLKEELQECQKEKDRAQEWSASYIKELQETVVEKDKEIARLKYPETTMKPKDNSEKNKIDVKF